jgi:hypothetical protein
MEGVVVYITDSDKVYVPLQAVHAITSKKEKLPSVSRGDSRFPWRGRFSRMLPSLTLNMIPLQTPYGAIQVHRFLKISQSLYPNVIIRSHCSDMKSSGKGLEHLPCFWGDEKRTSLGGDRRE